MTSTYLMKPIRSEQEIVVDLIKKDWDKADIFRRVSLVSWAVRIGVDLYSTLAELKGITRDEAKRQFYMEGVK